MIFTNDEVAAADHEMFLIATPSSVDGELKTRPQTPVELLRSTPFGTPQSARTPPSGVETKPGLAGCDPASRHTLTPQALPHTPTTPVGQGIELTAFGTETPAKNTETPHRCLFSTDAGLALRQPSDTPDGSASSDSYGGLDDLFNKDTRYADDFIDIGTLGRGCFGTVSKALHKQDGQTYAVKKSLRQMSGRTAVENSLQEVYAVASLPRCEHIVKYHDCWIEDDALFIRFEYCEGGNITSISSWSYDSLLVLFYQICIGLQFLHTQDMVHLDVKAENIYVSYKTGEPVYKLGDFGLVRKVGDEKQRWVGENEDEGDSRYLCQAFLKGSGDPKAADVFSLAATIYELARGEPLPPQGPRWQELRDRPATDLEGRYEAEFVGLLKACMDPSPAKRPTCIGILASPVFDRMKRHRADYGKIKAMESEVAALMEQLAGLTGSLSPSPQGLSPSNYASSPDTPPSDTDTAPAYIHRRLVRPTSPIFDSGAPQLDAAFPPRFSSFSPPIRQACHTAH
ncbi:Wee1-like protein kinase [Diplonema papillatum]|nr:Wee1-like protein kinase [Diplonema papillatum]